MPFLCKTPLSTTEGWLGFELMKMGGSDSEPMLQVKKMHNWLKTQKLHWRISKCCYIKQIINAKNCTPLITEVWWFKHQESQEDDLCTTHFICSNQFSPDPKNNSTVKFKHRESDICGFLPGLFPNNYVGRSHMVWSSKILSHVKI